MDRRQSQSEDELIAGLCRNTGDGGMSERTRKVLLDAIKMYLMSRERHNTSNVFSEPNQFWDSLNPLGDANEYTVSSANPTDAKTQGAQTERKDDMELLRKKLYKRYKEIQEVMDHKDRRIGSTYIYTTTNAKKVKVVFLKEVTYWIGVINRLIPIYSDTSYLFRNNEEPPRLKIMKESLQYIKQSIKEVRRHRQTQVPPVYMDPNETVFFGGDRPLAAEKEQTSFVPPVDKGVDQKSAGSDTQTLGGLSDGDESSSDIVKHWVDQWNNAFKYDPNPKLNYFGEIPLSLTFRKEGSEEELVLNYTDVIQTMNLIHLTKEPEALAQLSAVKKIQNHFDRKLKEVKEEEKKNSLRYGGRRIIF